MSVYRKEIRVITFPLYLANYEWTTIYKFYKEELQPYTVHQFQKEVYNKYIELQITSSVYFLRAV